MPDVPQVVHDEMNQLGIYTDDNSRHDPAWWVDRAPGMRPPDKALYDSWLKHGLADWYESQRSSRGLPGWQETKRLFQQRWEPGGDLEQERARDMAAIQYGQSQGMTLEQALKNAGLSETRGGGMALYKELMLQNQGMRRGNYQLDPVSGLKYDVFTSDLEKRMVPVPMDAQDWAYSQNAQQGGFWNDFASQVNLPGTQNTLSEVNQWLTSGSSDRFSFDPNTGYYINKNGDRWVDQYGFFVNPQSGQRTGGNYAAGSGFGRGSDYGLGAEDTSFAEEQLNQGLGGTSNYAGGGGPMGATPTGGAYGASGYGYSDYPSGGAYGGAFGLDAATMGAISPYLAEMAGSEAEVQKNLAQQARLDTLMQQWQYERAANEYAKGLGKQNFLENFYGDVLGVEWGQPDYSLSSYFQEGLGGAPEQSQLIADPAVYNESLNNPDYYTPGNFGGNVGYGGWTPEQINDYYNSQGLSRREIEGSYYFNPDVPPDQQTGGTTVPNYKWDTLYGDAPWLDPTTRPEQNEYTGRYMTGLDRGAEAGF